MDTDDVSTALREAQASSQLVKQQSSNFALRRAAASALKASPAQPRCTEMPVCTARTARTGLYCLPALYCPVQEELGLDPAAVHVVACLPPFLSKHLLSVTPVIGVIPPHLKFTPNPTEVSGVVPVASWFEVNWRPGWGGHWWACVAPAVHALADPPAPCAAAWPAPQVAAVFTAPLRRFLEAGPGYSNRDVEWEPGMPYRCAKSRQRLFARLCLFEWHAAGSAACGARLAPHRHTPMAASLAPCTAGCTSLILNIMAAATSSGGSPRACSLWWRNTRSGGGPLSSPTPPMRCPTLL